MTPGRVQQIPEGLSPKKMAQGDIACDKVADGARIDSPELVEAFGLTVPAQRVG